MDFFVKFIGGFVGAFAVIVLVLSVGITAVGKHYARVNCKQFSAQSGRQVKFVTYTYWSWDCLTPTGHGKWISIDNLREFGSN